MILALFAIMMGGAANSTDTKDVTYIDLCIGEEFEISLESNPTTGYSWTADYNESALELKEDKYYPYSKPKLIGGGGLQLFTFEALLPKESQVIMNYKRPWENESIFTERFMIRIAEGNITRINAMIDENFKISLEDNSDSTGHIWSANFDDMALDLVNATLEPYLPGIALPGMGGRRIFDFLPRKQGETDITMMLKAKNGATVREWIFRISIE